MTHYRDESSDEGIDTIILEKEIFGTLVLRMRDENIFSIFLEKWFPEPSTDDPIIQKGSEY